MDLDLSGSCGGRLEAPGVGSNAADCTRGGVAAFFEQFAVGLSILYDAPAITGGAGFR